MYKGKHTKIVRPPGSLSPYPELLKVADDHGWRSYLDWCDRGWVLDLRDDQDVLIRVRSSKKVPDAFRELGARGAAAVAQLELG
jgi:hypothetical protein